VKISPYLFFKGQCETAFKFYEKHLGAKILMMMPHEGTPAAEHVPPEWRSKIMHGRLAVGDQVLMGSDAPPGHDADMSGFSISLDFADPAEADRVFNALAENGTVRMPIGPTFWALRFGMLVDQFGTPWMINCEKPAA
jgi:PhnB protein